LKTDTELKAHRSHNRREQHIYTGISHIAKI